MTTKSLNDITEADTVLAMGDKQFSEPLRVTAVSRYDGSVVMVKLAGGRF